MTLTLSVTTFYAKISQISWDLSYPLQWENKRQLLSRCASNLCYLLPIFIYQHSCLFACLFVLLSVYFVLFFWPFIYSARSQSQTLAKAQHHSRQNKPHHCPSSRCWRHQPLHVLHGGSWLQGSSSVLEEFFFNWFVMNSNCRIVDIGSTYTTTLLLSVITFKYI